MSTRDGEAPPIDEDRDLLARVAQQDTAAHRKLFDRYLFKGEQTMTRLLKNFSGG